MSTQKTDYTVIGKYRNAENVRKIINAIKTKGKTCYDFTDKPADPQRPADSFDDQMKTLENHPDFLNDPVHRAHYERDLAGLKNAGTVVLLLPAGTSTHIEAGIAFGLGKKLVLIGKPEKPETLYYIFDEYYDSIEEFVEVI
ncbi:MAG: hypothetical protein JW874_02125 [Spirochaetales bacterium]|nr:hypothetical protein [Spirochaetales bacterium]